MSGSELNSDELRAAVREVLREVLPDGLPAGPGTVVSMRTDADLDVFVRRVAEMCEDPATRSAYRDGRHDYRLAGGPARTASGDAVPQTTGPTRIESGAVTERAVARAAKAGARLVLGPRAVLTPLARDRARALGVEIERER